MGLKRPHVTIERFCRVGGGEITQKEFCASKGLKMRFLPLLSNFFETTQARSLSPFVVQFLQFSLFIFTSFLVFLFFPSSVSLHKHEKMVKKSKLPTYFSYLCCCLIVLYVLYVLQTRKPLLSLGLLIERW